MTVVPTAVASARRAFVTRDGLVNTARRNSATRAAVTTANAKTEPASAFPVGTEDIALWKAVLEAVLAMDSAELPTMVIGSASALMDGMVPIALL